MDGVLQVHRNAMLALRVDRTYPEKSVGLEDRSCMEFCLCSVASFFSICADFLRIRLHAKHRNNN